MALVFPMSFLLFQIGIIRFVHKIEIHFSCNIYINTDRISNATILSKLEMNYKSSEQNYSNKENLVEN